MSLPIQTKKAVAVAANLSTFKVMQNHFETLGFAPSYMIDNAELRSAYLRAQSVSHPDRQIGKSDAERQKAALDSAAANDALRVLEDDYLRAVHLLEIKDITINGDKATTKPNGMLLMEVMEWGEEAEDNATSSMLEDFKVKRSEVIALLGEQFGAPYYEKAAQNAIRLRYIDKTIELIEHHVKAIAS